MNMIDDIFNNYDIKFNKPFIIEHTGDVICNFIYYLNHGGLYKLFFDASLQGEELTKAIAYFKVYVGIDI